MSYQVLLRADEINNVRTKSRCVTYLIRQNTDIRAAQVTLPAGVDAQAYGEANAAALFAAGVEPAHKADPLALFYAQEAQLKEGYFLNVIFQAIYQLKLGGSLGNMVTAARVGFGEDDAELAKWQAFEAAYNAADADDRNALLAMAVYISLNLVVREQN